MTDKERREITWVLAEKIFVQIQIKEFGNGRHMTTSSLVKYSYDVAAEFVNSKATDLEKFIETKE